MADFGLFVACWGGKCFIAWVCVWCRGGKCFTARLGVLCSGVVSFVPVMVPRLVREKIRPARLVGDKSGTKLSQQEQNAPNEAILGEQGEFCTGAGGVWLVLGEFCTGNAAAWGAWGEFYTGSGGVWRVLGEFWPIVPPHSVDGGREVGITKPPGTRPGGGGAGDGNRTRL